MNTKECMLQWSKKSNSENTPLKILKADIDSPVVTDIVTQKTP